MQRTATTKIEKNRYGNLNVSPKRDFIEDLALSKSIYYYYYSKKY